MLESVETLISLGSDVLPQPSLLDRVCNCILNMVSGLGSRVSGLESRVLDLGSRVSGLGSRVSARERRNPHLPRQRRTFPTLLTEQQSLEVQFGTTLVPEFGATYWIGFEGLGSRLQSVVTLISLGSDVSTHT